MANLVSKERAGRLKVDSRPWKQSHHNVHSVAVLELLIVSHGLPQHSLLLYEC